MVGQQYRIMRRTKLAANSDAEKRLYRADVLAGRKCKAAAVKGKKKREFFRKRLVLQVSVAAQPMAAGNSSSFSLAPNQQYSSSSARAVPVVQGLGPCFLCGKMGHFRKSCPVLQILALYRVSNRN